MIKKMMDSTKKDETEQTRRKLSQLASEANWRELTQLVTQLRRENAIETSLQARNQLETSRIFSNFFFKLFSKLQISHLTATVERVCGGRRITVTLNRRVLSSH